MASPLTPTRQALGIKMPINTMNLQHRLCGECRVICDTPKPAGIDMRAGTRAFTGLVILLLLVLGEAAKADAMNMADPYAVAPYTALGGRTFYMESTLVFDIAPFGATDPMSRSRIVGIHDDGLIAGYQQTTRLASPLNASITTSGFISGQRFDVSCDPAQIYCGTIGGFVALQSKFSGADEAVLAMASRTNFPGPLLLTAYLPVQTGRISNKGPLHICDPFVPEPPVTLIALVEAEWRCVPVPDVNVFAGPSDRVFANAAALFAATLDGVGEDIPLVVDARAGLDALRVISLLGAGHILGLNDSNLLIGATALNDAGRSWMAQVNDDGTVTTRYLPTSWHISIAGTGSWDIPLTQLLPIAVNNYQIILRAENYDAAAAICSGTACVTPLPPELFEARHGDLFYCLLREQCSHLYAVGRTEGTGYRSASEAGAQLSDIGLLLSGAALPRVATSDALDYHFGNDGVLIGPDRYNDQPDTLIFNVRRKTGPIIHFNDLLANTGWRNAYIAARTLDGNLAGWATSTETGQQQTVLFTPHGDTNTSQPKVESGSGSVGIWLLFALICIGARRRG